MSVAALLGKHGQAVGETNMFDLNALFTLIINIISIPFQIYKQLMFTGLDFLAFDVLRLGQ